MNQTKTFKMTALMLFFVLCVGTRLQAQFITTWITTDNTITIPTTGGGYNYTVTWTNLTNAGVGNGTISGRTGDHTIIGLQNGSTYSVALTGGFPRFYMGLALPNPNAPKLRTIAQWGTNVWTSMNSAFYNCINLSYTATDNPNLSSATDMGGMFSNCSLFNGNIGGWNTTSITNMNGVFINCTNFNQNIGSWITTNVTNMSQMFAGATSFNGNIGSWNTINVTNMGNMFNGCTSFNQNIGSWITTNNTNMSNMFSGCTFFNQNIGSWITTNVVNMDGMFFNCISFNGNIGSWITTNVISMASMFGFCTNFNQNISGWNTINVTSMSAMFSNCINFNQNISGWNTGGVVNMFIMFNGATVFNQNLGGWNIGNIIDMNGMLNNSGLSVANYDATLIGWAAQTRSNITLGAVGLKYCAGTAARATLTGASRNWAIGGDAPLTITISPTSASLSAGVVGTSYSQTITQAGLTGTPTWSISVGTLPAGLSIAPTTGIISGTPTASGTSSFTVQVSGGCSQTKTYSIAITCPAITFTNTSATNGVLGTAYNLNAATTGLPSPVYSVSPALPLGLSLNTSTGAISGTPTTATVSNTYTVTAAQGGCSAAQGYTFAITCPTITFTNTTAPSGVVGTAYTFSAVATGNTATLTYSVSPALPLGLSLNTSSGLISGTPTTLTASATYTVTVAQGGCSATQGYTFAVSDCTPVVLNPNLLALPNATLGVPYSLTMTATGGTVGNTIYSYTTLTPMPEGLSFVNGFLSGTPRFSTSVTFLVKAVTPSGCDGSRVYTLVILPDPATAIDSSISSLIKVYPNPSNGIFNVDLQGLNLGKSLVRVYDAQGKSVYSSEINSNESSISLENMASGIYLMEINTNKGRILKRLVKQ